MRDYQFQVELLIDVAGDMCSPVMVEDWRKQLHRLAGARLIKDLENVEEPFTIATTYRHERTVNLKEMRLMLEVQVKFLPSKN